MRCRGFLLGGTAGRTTLNGEGLQHEDGHSHVLASTIPNCASYDPTFAYEVVVIIRDGIRKMYEEQQDVYYYVTLMNENYRHPAMPQGAEEGIVKGMYLLRESSEEGKQRVQLLGSGTILREVLAAAELLEAEHGLAADVWSVTSFTELARAGSDADRWNLLHPTAKPRVSYLEQTLAKEEGVFIAPGTDPWIEVDGKPVTWPREGVPEAEGNDCECEGSPVPGVLTSANSEAGIQRCDPCHLFPGDLEAAFALAKLIEGVVKFDEEVLR